MSCRHHSFTSSLSMLWCCVKCAMLWCRNREKRMLFFCENSSSKLVMLPHNNRNSPKKKNHWFGTLLWFLLWRRIKCHWTRTQQLKAIITIISVAHITNEAYCLAKHSHSFAKFHFFCSYIYKPFFKEILRRRQRRMRNEMKEVENSKAMYGFIISPKHNLRLVHDNFQF